MTGETATLQNRPDLLFKESKLLRFRELRLGGEYGIRSPAPINNKQ
jgi:hypothetical protein